MVLRVAVFTPFEISIVFRTKEIFDFPLFSCYGWNKDCFFFTHFNSFAMHFRSYLFCVGRGVCQLYHFYDSIYYLYLKHGEGIFLTFMKLHRRILIQTHAKKLFCVFFWQRENKEHWKVAASLINKSQHFRTKAFIPNEFELSTNKVFCLFSLRLEFSLRSDALKTFDKQAYQLHSNVYNWMIQVQSFSHESSPMDCCTAFDIPRFLPFSSPCSLTFHFFSLPPLSLFRVHSFSSLFAPPLFFHLALSAFPKLS